MSAARLTPSRAAPRARRVVDAPARFRRPGAPTAIVGHMGAPSLAPANTAASFLAAQAAGADGIELDLIAIERGTVLVAHDLGDADRRPDALELASLEQLLGQPPMAEMPVLLDVKSHGVDRALAAALIGARLTPRAIISSFDPEVLRQLSLRAPQATRSLTFPRSRHTARTTPWGRRLARARERATGFLLPVLVRRAVQRHQLHAITVNHRLVTPSLCRMARRLGVELIVWTVDDPADARRLLALDVDAIITNDPELMLTLRAEQPAGDGMRR